MSRNPLYRRKETKNDKKGEVIEESVAARKPIRAASSNTSISGLNEEDTAQPKRPNLENIANLKLY